MSRIVKRMGYSGVFNTATHVFTPTPEMAAAERALFKDGENHIHIFGPRRHGKTTMQGHLLRTAAQYDHTGLFIHTPGMDDLPLQEASKELFFCVRRAYISSNKEPAFGEMLNQQFKSYKADLPKSDDPLEHARYFRERLQHIASIMSQAILLVFDESESALIPPHNDFFIAVLKSKEPGFKMVTSTLYPLPWIKGLRKDFANAVPHVRIGAMRPESANEIADSLPHDDAKKRLEVAQAILKQTGGHGAMTAEIVETCKERFESNPQFTLSEFFERIASEARHGHRSLHFDNASLQHLLNALPGKLHKAVCKGYADLISGDEAKTIQMEPAAALALNLTGLAPLAADGITVGPVAPLLRELFDSHFIYGWQRRGKREETPFRFDTPGFRQIAP